MQCVESNPGLDDAVAAVSGSLKFAGRLVGPGVCAFLLLRWREDYGAEVTDKFFHRLASGDDLGKTSPILLLRNRLIDTLQGHTRMRRRISTAMLIKVFHAFREDRRLGVIKIGEREEFPEVSPGISP